MLLLEAKMKDVESQLPYKREKNRVFPIYKEFRDESQRADAARQRRMESYEYSSSEDDEPYELQPPCGAYTPVTGPSVHTGCHSPAGIMPSPTPPP